MEVGGFNAEFFKVEHRGEFGMTAIGVRCKCDN